MTEPLLYPVTPKHPPMCVRVIVQWNNRTMTAARVFHPKHKVLCWVTRRKDGSDRYLPPKAARRGPYRWSDNPEGWRPEQPEEWKAPLPTPLPPLPAWRRHDGKERFVDIRARHRRSEPPEERTADEKAPWWWDATRIEYEPAGFVSQLMAEGRMLRAAAVAGAGQIVRPGVPCDRLFRDLVEAMAEAEREAQAKGMSQLRERLMLGPADHRDWLTAMSWFAALNPPELRDPGEPPFNLNDKQKVLIWRAEGLSFIQIKRLFGLSHRESARRLYLKATEMVWRAANGREVYPHVAKDQISLLQARNRAYHNRERQYA